MYVPRSALTSTVARGQRLDADRRLLASGSCGAGARWLFAFEVGDGDKGVNNGGCNGEDREWFILLLSTKLFFTNGPLTPTFHSWKLVLHHSTKGWHSASV